MRRVMTRVALACTAAATLGLAPAIAQSTPSATTGPEEALFGQYQIGFGGNATLILEDASSVGGSEVFRILDDDGQLLVRGVYIVANDLIYFTDMAGETACPITIAGRYAYTVSRNAMAFTQIAENCDARSQRLGAMIPVSDDTDGTPAAETQATEG